MSEDLNHSVVKELFITSDSSGVKIALLEDKKLVEVHEERSSDHFGVGDIYLGVTKKLNSGMNAAFVNIGAEKDAFLHYLDLGNHFNTMKNFVNDVINTNKKSIANYPYEPELPKVGKIGEVLSSGQKLLLQIAKEPISTKGATVTTEISLAGRYLVLVPFMDKIFISQKITRSSEKRRLRKLVQSIKPKKFGIIVRTVATGKEMEELQADLDQLMDRWKVIVDKLSMAVAPAKIASELDMTTSLIRDMINDSFESIYVDDPLLFQELKQYLHSVSPEYTHILKLYKNPKPLFEAMNITKQIKASFGKNVTIKNGVYLVIEHTEAMHVIDVNSGNRAKAGKDQEENVLTVNMEAAVEIARQLRLRDMGGIISIDFIDMKKPANRTALYQKMLQLMKDDKAKHTILPVNKFGIIQITRQRVRQEKVIHVAETCPSCRGTGKVQPTILIVKEMQEMIEYIINQKIASRFYIKVHPIIYAYLTRKLYSHRFKWSIKYKRWIKLVPDESFQLLDYRFYNRMDEQIMFWTSPAIDE